LVLCVRKASFDDLDILLRVEAECFGEEAFSRDQLVYCLSSPDFVSLTALADGEIVGFVIGSAEKATEGSVGHAYTLDVEKGCRRQGIGGKLLEAFESALVKMGVRFFVLEVRVDNVAARRLYSKHGYKPVAKLRDYYDEGVDAVRLKKAAAAP